MAAGLCDNKLYVKESEVPAIESIRSSFCEDMRQVNE